jgi:hypothetical protein
MLRVAMSQAAAGVLRALLARANVRRDRILLTELRSVDWQSLTFIGERHEIELRIPPPTAAGIARAVASGLAEAEFNIPGQIVADIALTAGPRVHPDSSITLQIEALTIAE